MIKINIEKAKQIWLDKFRIARNPILEQLDVDFIKAVEQGDIDLQKEISIKKQLLRDITETQLPDDLEGIKDSWPEILGEKPI